MPGIDINYFMRQANKLQKELEAKRAELNDVTVEGSAGDGSQSTGGRRRRHARGSDYGRHESGTGEFEEPDAHGTLQGFRRSTHTGIDLISSAVFWTDAVCGAFPQRTGAADFMRFRSEEVFFLIRRCWPVDSQGHHRIV